MTLRELHRHIRARNLHLRVRRELPFFSSTSVIAHLRLRVAGDEEVIDSIVIRCQERRLVVRRWGKNWKAKI
jgi:hypothetical protein